MMQDDTLSGHVSSTDKATNKNMKDLVKTGESLLHKPVSRMNLDTGIFEPVGNEDTNEKALIRYSIAYLFVTKLYILSYIHHIISIYVAALLDCCIYV